jgi:hypothetical protein
VELDKLTNKPHVMHLRVNLAGAPLLDEEPQLAVQRL